MFASGNGSTPAPGDVVYQSSFESPEEREVWSLADFAQWADGRTGSTVLRVTVPPGASDGGHMIHAPLAVERYRGCVLLFECAAKAEAVTKPRESYFGVKFMVHVRTGEAGDVWHNENNVFGTFDWRPLRFTLRIAPDARDGELYLGLQDCSGTAWFDDVKVTVLKGPPAPRPAPNPDAPPPLKGHELPRLRGVMSPNEYRDGDLRALADEWKANVIRWQIGRNWGEFNTDRDLAEYDQWMARELEDLDKALADCLAHGIKLVIDLHGPPGGRYPNYDLAIFHERLYHEHWRALWVKIAERYKDHAAVWGYDLVNEPMQVAPSPEGVLDCLAAQEEVARAIRTVDPETPIVIAATEGDSPQGFVDLEPVEVSNVIYQVHLYAPHEFTHQGVGREWTPVTYPGVIGGKVWDKEQIRKTLQPVRDFQRAYNVHIFVGEFSAIRWAPGAVDYLRDCIEIFEEYGWDWTYHAYREWHGWSLDHGSDPDNLQPVPDLTDRGALLREWFGRNERP